MRVARFTATFAFSLTLLLALFTLPASSLAQARDASDRASGTIGGIHSAYAIATDGSGQTVCVDTLPGDPPCVDFVGAVSGRSNAPIC